jgi:2-keto-4-pentenoate hydratase/2-oxohepta-3-ene-1,7-dioic acid hydratase in catechol pathway
MPLREAVLEAPIPRPRRNIYCVGKNYHEHAKEFAASSFDSGALYQAPLMLTQEGDSRIV